MTGAHVFVKGRISGGVDEREITEELNEGGHFEIYGYPANGRVVGTRWLHIENTPRHTVPEVQDEIDELVDDEDQMSDQEQANAVVERYKSQVRGDQSVDSRSKYHDLDPVPLANTGPFRSYGRNGQGPHPVHGATTSHDNPGPDDKDSTNFGVDSQKGWNCWAHDDDGVRSN